MNRTSIIGDSQLNVIGWMIRAGRSYAPNTEAGEKRATCLGPKQSLAPSIPWTTFLDFSISRFLVFSSLLLDVLPCYQAGDATRMVFASEMLLAKASRPTRYCLSLSYLSRIHERASSGPAFPLSSPLFFFILAAPSSPLFLPIIRVLFFSRALLSRLPDPLVHRLLRPTKYLPFSYTPPVSSVETVLSRLNITRIANTAAGTMGEERAPGCLRQVFKVLGVVYARAQDV